MAGGLICGHKASKYADRNTSKKARMGGRKKGVKRRKFKSDTSTGMIEVPK
ncbi:hypothetical protein FH972_027161 [Carpinus fangiana]|uniref:Uncharacterized protein n=1 Tax=Carpinus fangiana TaxID=176857 RepID=A0A5N6L657_9ROSI|nr:hypothetical protein FH972_027161 [Carpinus fangiana]